MKNDNVLLKAEISADETGIVSGIAWPFDGPDTEGDIINKGAFAFAPDVPMFIDHDGRQAVGVWKSYRETDAGLEVTGRLFIEASAPAREAHRLLRKGIITGLSISGPVTGSERLPTGGRNIHGVTVNEISLCKRPVNSGARVTLVKSIQEGNQMENELENAPEAKADPVISADEFKALKEDMKVVKAKLNRPIAANNNHPSPDNDNSARKAFAHFLRTGLDAAPESVRKALTVGADELTGYVLAPEETSAEFIRNLVEFSPVRALADVRTAGSHTVVLPKRLSVTNAKWKGEATASDPSEPTFGDMEISVKELNTHVDLSNWIIEDASADVVGEVNLALAEDFGTKESAAFVNGTGAAPAGFMTETAISSALNGHATNLSGDALITLMYSLPGTYRNRGTWAMSGTTLAAIRTLKDGNGNYLWQPSYQAGQPETILGRPVVELIDMPDIEADETPIIFGDFKSGYRIYDRISFGVRPNPYLLATEGQVRFHARRRVGAGVVRPDAFRKLKMAA
ncbi:phage major capsid protein [Rhizobium sp. BK491]|uniref:phage major capsid protein n=1 Tax=Rhizobium sp. BK491 TaxID=2587009 RepID=UPI00161B8E89|nr:phage major capsid protein [Rhizobium sp. BK491]MBB3566075.1 HK97 family phage major capsid protein/HK97 family phage prohead protease [Rhizobium sp. BK491]